MKKRGPVYLLILLILSGAAMLLRKLELLTVLDEGGLAVFRPVTAVLAALCVLAALFSLLFARRFPGRDGPGELDRYPGLGAAGVVWGAVCLLIQLFGAWLLFKAWKHGGGTLDLVLALLAGLAGAGWLCLRIARLRGAKAGNRLLAASLVTLFYCLWLIVYYRDEAPEPSLVLTVYGFLALCACCAAACSLAAGTVGRMKPRSALVFCSLGMLLSLTAQVRDTEPAAFRLFWIAGALQFAHSILVLLGEPETAPEPAEVPAEAEASADAAPAETPENDDPGASAGDAGDPGTREAEGED